VKLAIRTLIFTLLVPGTVTVWAPCLILSSGHREHPPGLWSLRLLGLVPMALGLSFYLWCAWDFFAAGKGTPALWDSPREFVSRGLYRFTRNPMYVGVVLVLLGEALMFASLPLLVNALLIGIGFHLFIRFYEEPTLRRRYGAAYSAYSQSVPRWLPGLKRPGR
jgi:protein-S-isoprenylcysteine O-methyltransferase Ste14